MTIEEAEKLIDALVRPPQLKEGGRYVSYPATAEQAEEITARIKGNVNNWSKLRIVDGVIHYGVYQQDGSMQPMTAPDTMHNRQVVSWIQMHDRNVGF